MATEKKYLLVEVKDEPASEPPKKPWLLVFIAALVIMFFLAPAKEQQGLLKKITASTELSK